MQSRPEALPASIFKILTQEQDELFRREGRFVGSADDERDGFIHLCTAEQLESTIAAHFSRAPLLVLVELATERLTPELRFERSRGGAWFPHLYRALFEADVIARLQRHWP